MKTSEREALQQQIDALQAKLDSLPKEPDFEPVIGWKPNSQQLYHLYDVDGSHISQFWMDNGLHNWRYKREQLGKTQEQAKHIDAQKAARLRVLRRIEELNEGWVADFGDKDSMKFVVCYDHCYQRFDIVNCVSLQFLEQHEYCRTHEIAQQVIDECGEDWKLFKGIK